MDEMNLDPELKKAMADEVTTEWHLIRVKARVDSFTQVDLMNELKESVKAGRKKIALDLHANGFFSLPVIRLCVEIASQLAHENQGGELVLISCPERTKRHFEIYGSLKYIRVLRSPLDLSRAA